MEVKFGRVSWKDLAMIRKAAKLGDMQFDGVKEVKRKLLDGFLRAVDAEMKRKEMAGEQLHGAVTLSIDLKIEPERRLLFPVPTKRISLQELDELANERERKAIENEARLARLEELAEAGTPATEDLAFDGISGVN